MNVKIVHTQSSCLTSGEAASSFAPLLQSEDERWWRRNQTFLTGRWLPSHDEPWLVCCLSHLSWVRPLFLPSTAPISAVQYAIFYFFCVVVLFSLFLLLSCHCLGGLGHYICIWSSMLDIKCVCWTFSLCFFQRPPRKLAAIYIAQCMLSWNANASCQSVISSFYQYTVSALSFRTFARIGRANSNWLPVLQALPPFPLCGLTVALMVNIWVLKILPLVKATCLSLGPQVPTYFFQAHCNCLHGNQDLLV